MNIYACHSCILSLKMAVIFFPSQLGGGKLLHLQCLFSGFLNRVPDRERTVVQALVPGWILIGLWSQCMLLIMAIHFVEFCHCSQGIVLKTSPKQIPSSGCMVTTFLCAGYCELLVRLVADACERGLVDEWAAAQWKDPYSRSRCCLLYDFWQKCYLPWVSYL